MRSSKPPGQRRQGHVGLARALAILLWTTTVVLMTTTVSAGTAEKSVPEREAAPAGETSPPPTETEAAKKPAPARRPRGTDGFVPSRKLPADSPVSLPTDI